MNHAIGIDVGGSKIAAALIDLQEGNVVRESRQPTPANDGARALQACVAAAVDLEPNGDTAVGIALCELVDLSGRPQSAVRVDWRELDVAAAFAGIGSVRIVSDVRAAARAEARFGAGRPFRNFVYLSVGTGISYSLVLEGCPYSGARGNALILGAPPVEQLASGAALSRRANVGRAEHLFSSPAYDSVIAEAAAELGRAVAWLVHALDPEAVVIGGGLGAVDRYRNLVVETARRTIEPYVAQDLPVLPAALGERSGVVGAALAGVVEDSRSE